MSRIKDAVLARDTAYATHGPVLDLKEGGQQGYLSQVGKIGDDGKVYDAWISNQAYVKRNIIPVVLAYPKFFDFMPEKDSLIEAYKALIELHPQTIDGLTSGLTVETDSHTIGGAGEEQEEITNVVRAKSSLSFSYKEKAGKSIQKFLDFVIRYGYMDPDTKKPLVSTFIKSMDEIGGMYTPEYYTGTVIFIEPDALYKEVVDAWLCTNMFFKSNGDRTGKRDIKVGGETLDLTIESSCITMNNEATLKLADTILGKLTIISDFPEDGIVVAAGAIDATLAKEATGYNQAGTK